MARNPTPTTTTAKAATAPTTTKPAAEQANASTTETANQEAKQAAEQQAKEAEGAANAQREDVEAGGTGALDEKGAELATAYNVTDPKAAPVDYSVQTARKPAQRTIQVEEMSDRAMPRAPVAVIPYGSEPRTFDPEKGEPRLTPMAPAQEPRDDQDGDDTDADVDAGASAAQRASRA